VAAGVEAGRFHDSRRDGGAASVTLAARELRYNLGMRRWLSIAAFGLVMISLPAWAQRHGGGGGHSAPSGRFGAHSSGSFHSSGFSHSGNFSHNSGVRVHIGTPFYNRGYGRRSYYPYGSYYPYAGYYPWYLDSYADQNTDDQTADSYADGNYPGPYRQDDSGLQRDVQTLSGKIDRLQAEAEARNRPKEQEPATALVFRDQHVEEVHNYAIAGGTLWVFNDAAAKKIPLAQLDIPATVKMNDDRGLDFQVPGPSLSLRIMN